MRTAASVPELHSLALYNCTRIALTDLAAFTSLTKLRVEYDEAEPDEVETLRLRLVLPECQINGSWYAAAAVQQRLAALGSAP